MNKEIIIDAKNKIVGRLASFVAKELLKGNKIIIVNVEKAVVSGKREVIIEKFMEKVKRGDAYKGPFYPKYPDEIFRRIVRGMLPYKKERGKTALKNLKVFYGLPEEYKDKITNIKIKDVNDLMKTGYISLEDISLSIGAKKRW
ncbi:MAG: 50S ribosomal protein L13 [Candidatus Aenigmatarchaeota archaeon]